MAQQMGPGHTIITILCDSGMRHLTKFYNEEYLSQYGLTPTASGLEFLGLNSGKDSFLFPLMIDLLNCMFFTFLFFIFYFLSG